MAPQFIYSMQNVRKVVEPARELIRDMTLAFYPDAKIGVLGANGAGKSTLMRIMAGVDKDFDGETWLAPGTRVGYLSQEPQLDESLDVRGNVLIGVAEIQALLDHYNELSAKLAEPMDDDEMQRVMDEFGELQDQIEAVDAWDLERHIDVAMDALRLPAGDADVSKLSGGERRRVALCQLLLSRPDMLLLDEPTNHLDAESVAWLEHFLHDFPGMVLAVTHDRYFLDNVAGWILELDRGHGIPYQGNYTSWLEQKQQRLGMEEKQQASRARALARELDWVRMSPKARQAKGKARLKGYEQLRAEHENQQGRERQIEIQIPAGPRLGQMVVEAKNLRKAYGEQLLVEDLNFKLPPGAIVGVIGGNGAGKTTLFRMIIGQEKPDAGEILLGDSVKLSYVDQSRDALDAENNVWQEISEGAESVVIDKREINSRAYVSWFNFRGGEQQKLVGELSGGERNRVHLAKMLKTGGNLLLLDEPTNDLDIETLRALENALLDYPGCAIVISHDRWFLDRIATHILAFEDNSHVEWFEGNFQDYEDWKKAQLGEDALKPHRVRYKPLHRK